MNIPSQAELSLASGKVAVITRTKNRPMMLARALESVAGQNRRDIVWMIINDGGSPDPVDNMAETARARGISVQVIHHAASRGMEAASNAGIRASRSEYLCIHDDDDTWQAGFLEKTISFLDSYPAYAGAVTQVTQVNETLEGDRIRITKKHAWRRPLESIYLADMARRTLFPPIALLFRRDAMEAVGFFNEDLPVLGDWDFHLRFLARFEIGVVNEYLANYHQRKKAAGAYGNSIHFGLNLHLQYDARLRNQWLRQDLKNEYPGLGWLVNLSKPTRFEALAEAAAETVYTIFERTGLLWLLRKLLP